MYLPAEDFDIVKSTANASIPQYPRSKPIHEFGPTPDISYRSRTIGYRNWFISLKIWISALGIEICLELDHDGKSRAITDLNFWTFSKTQHEIEQFTFWSMINIGVFNLWKQRRSHLRWNHHPIQPNFNQFRFPQNSVSLIFSYFKD
jgi:hypothetical protein